MSEKKTAEAETPVAQPQQVSRNRQITATATSLVVSVVLSSLAAYGINKVTARVQTAINPPQTEATTSE